MGTEREQLQAGIAALEAQRALLGDAVAEAALAPLRAKLAALPLPDAPLASSAQTLKQVTILFLDVVGSTTLSQHLDPEEIHAVMDGALARCTAIVGSYRGKVLQYAGDSLLAVFGADEACEDDPERAVHASLSLLEEGRRQGKWVERQYGRAGFSFRAGLHTGSVLLGGGVDAEGSIRGIAVSIAARMEQTAPAGTLRISRDTYRHVRGLFEVEAQPALPVKGLDEPLVTYLVLRAKPRAFRVAARGIEGVPTRMVGRDSELEQLREAFKALFENRELVAVTVVGEAGVGKSRLLYEFETWAETQPGQFTVFQGRATPQTQSQPYGLLHDILAWRLQIADSDSGSAAKHKIEQGIAPLFADDDGEDQAQAHAHLLGHLIGFDFGDSKHIRGIRDDGKQIRDRAFHAAAQMFRRVAAKDDAPIVLLLEDLHWADEGSLDFLARLTRINRDVPMLILGLTRPTLFERPASWPGNTDGRRIELGPLDESASRLLANELLRKLPEVPAALEALISGGAEGNPFYMEELVNMLVDQGAIEAEPQRWTLHPHKLLAAHVPQTLTGVLQARLDGLPATERFTLQEASVIGFVFWDQALVAIDPQAGLSLPTLVQRALALPRQSVNLEGMREYVFRHHILHHVTYETLLKRTRCELHARVAAWLASLADVRANDFLGITAEHYDKAGDAANAAEYHSRAADHARDRFAHDSALHHVQRALTLLDAAPLESEPPPVAAMQLRWRLLLARERTLDLKGQRREQRVDLDALDMLADALDDDGRKAYVAFRWSVIAMRTADWKQCETAARRTMALAERVGDHALRLSGQRLLASALTSSGNPEAGRALAQQGLAEARERGLRANEAAFLNTMSVVASLQQDLMGLLELARQSLAIDRETGNRRSEAITLGTLGASWMGLGDHVQAKRDLEEALRLIRTNGDRSPESTTLINLSQLALWQGEDVRALALANSALETALSAEARDWEAVALLYIGHAEQALGRHAAAAQAYKRAQARAREVGHSMEHIATAGLARVALAQGDTAEALRQVNGVLAYLDDGGKLEATQSPTFIELTCYQVLARSSDLRAAEWLERAHTHLMAKAATIPDAQLRKGFLKNIPEHREIMAAWTAAQLARGNAPDAARGCG
jgi:class 3 adenylate cyclase/tetratricopeptide (TPR) repeat protein